MYARKVTIPSPNFHDAIPSDSVDPQSYRTLPSCSSRIPRYKPPSSLQTLNKSSLAFRHTPKILTADYLLLLIHRITNHNRYLDVRPFAAYGYHFLDSWVLVQCHRPVRVRDPNPNIRALDPNSVCFVEAGEFGGTNALHVLHFVFAAESVAQEHDKSDQEEHCGDEGSAVGSGGGRIECEECGGHDGLVGFVGVPLGCDAMW
jgi:hypothetical protein